MALSAPSRLYQIKEGGAMSYKVEIQVSGETTWTGNALRFATKQEAETYAKDLARRWFLVKEWRIAESNEVVNYCLNNDGSLEPVLALAG